MIMLMMIKMIMIIILMIMVMVIIIILMIVEIIMKDVNKDFYKLLTAPRTVSNTHAQVVRTQSCANHVQHVKRLSRATCRVPHGRDGSAVKLKSHVFKLCSIS